MSTCSPSTTLNVKRSASLGSSMLLVRAASQPIGSVVPTPLATRGTREASSRTGRQDTQRDRIIPSFRQCPYGPIPPQAVYSLLGSHLASDFSLLPRSRRCHMRRSPAHGAV